MGRELRDLRQSGACVPVDFSVARHECVGEVEIRAVGVGLDLSALYRHGLAIDADEPADNRSQCEIVWLNGRR